MNKILGKKVKDKVSGFLGTATAVVECLNGCIQVEITPKVGKDNKIEDGIQCDSQNILVYRSGKWLRYCDYIDDEEEYTGGLSKRVPSRL